MAVTYKDIDLLTQKSAVAGTEKIPVSDTQYITPNQIAKSKVVFLEDESDMPVEPDPDTVYLIEDDGAGGGISDVTLGGSSVVSNGVAVLPAYPTTLPASDVYSWAKASTKPSYTAGEVGALPSSTSIPTDSTVSGWGFPKYVLLADEAAYTALSTKDSGTLYLIPKTS